MTDQLPDTWEACDALQDRLKTAYDAAFTSYCALIKQVRHEARIGDREYKKFKHARFHPDVLAAKQTLQDLEEARLKLKRHMSIIPRPEVPQSPGDPRYISTWALAVHNVCGPEIHERVFTEVRRLRQAIKRQEVERPTLSVVGQ